MAERVIISVDPGPLEQSQRVQDVFGHVLDLFDLLGQSGQPDDSIVAWRLVRVSMNSPLTVEAEAIAVRAAPANVDVRAAARRQRSNFIRNVASLRSGVYPDAWRKELPRAKRAFGHSDVSITRVEAPQSEGTESERVEVAPVDHPVVERAIQAAAREVAVRPKTQRGSIEGQLVEVGTHYNKPAIRVLERRSRTDIWCVVSETHREEISAHANFNDVWSGRRVRVNGTLFYEDGGGISRVIADAVEIINARDVAVDEIRDASATQGMSTEEYLERFREGTLG